MTEPDLEKPYVDAARHADAVEDRSVEIRSEIWSDLKELKEAEKLVQEHEPDFLPRIIQMVAANKGMDAYLLIRGLIDELVWKLAEKRAAEYEPSKERDRDE